MAKNRIATMSIREFDAKYLRKKKKKVKKVVDKKD